MENCNKTKALSRAKIQLMASPDSTFFCRIMLSLAHIWDDKQPTAYTDGRKIAYNSDFFMQCSEDERVGLILHETMHVVYSHMLRLNGRNQQKWNNACDYVINLQILDSGFRLPADGLVNAQFRDMSADEVYALLPEPPPDGSGNGWQDLVFGNPGDGTEEKIQAEIDDMIVQAAIETKLTDVGKIPGDIERYVENLIRPQVPWYRVLRSFMTKMSKTDYSFRKPNRRFFPDHILPTQYSTSVCNIVVGTDVSGSVDNNQFDHFIGETAGILKSLKPDKLTFLQFDTRITQEDELKCLNDMQRVKFTGRGGTDINPLMEWANRHRPSVLIVFTDGYFYEPEINPGIPILWVIYENPGFQAPFGKVIHYQFKK